MRILAALISPIAFPGLVVLRMVTARWAWLCRCSLVLGLSVVAALAQQAVSVRATGGEGRPSRSTRVNVVASSETVSSVNHNDARAVLKSWFESVGRQRGIQVDCRIDVVDGVSEIRERLQNHSVDVILPGIAEYLELESSHLMVPRMTLALSPQGGPLYSYVLLVNPSSGATTISGMRGKNILVSSRGGSNTGVVWTEVLLGKEKLGRAGNFFASVKTPDKAQACILPLFFDAVDACVVDEISLNLAKEMNPQLRKLKVLARSRPLTETVISTSVIPHPFETELIDAILSLREDVSHRQLLMVFKTDRILRTQPGDLDSVRELFREYYRLPGSLPGSLLNRASGSESSQTGRGKERD